MELFTLTKKFEKDAIIEEHESLIWTERYFGDGEVEIILPISMKNYISEKIPLNSFLGLDESNEPMIVETALEENGKWKIEGISICQWLNNRFVRTSNRHKVKSWELVGLRPGEILWTMVNSMCDPDSSYLTTERTGIPQNYLDKLKIPEIGLYNYDASGDPVIVAISFAPLYDEMKKIATTFQIGMQIVLMRNLNPDAERPLGFRSYYGLDRTFMQDPDVPQNDIVRFSSQLNSLGNVKQLCSQAVYKTIAFVFASNTDADLGNNGSENAGVAFPMGMGDPDTFTGFDCRATQIFADDISGYPEPLSGEDIVKIITMLGNRGRNVLANSTLINVVDGDVVESGMFQYGRDYNLGDLVEIQGSDGAITPVRVTEYIRSQDSSGERRYGIFSRNADEIT